MTILACDLFTASGLYFFQELPLIERAHCNSHEGWKTLASSCQIPTLGDKGKKYYKCTVSTTMHRLCVRPYNLSWILCHWLSKTNIVCHDLQTYCFFHKCKVTSLRWLKMAHPLHKPRFSTSLHPTERPYKMNTIFCIHCNLSCVTHQVLMFAKMGIIKKIIIIYF